MHQTALKKQSPKAVRNQTSTYDEGLVNAIRNGTLIQVPWSQLTPEERRMATNMLFRPCEY